MLADHCRASKLRLLLLYLPRREACAGTRCAVECEEEEGEGGSTEKGLAGGSPRSGVPSGPPSASKAFAASASPFRCVNGSLSEN